jgi:hypothetical protein
MPETKQVQDRARPRALAPVLALALLAGFCGAPARAEIFPLLNASTVVSSSTVQATGGPLNDTQIRIAPPNPLEVWNGSAFSNVSDSPNSAFGLMTMSFSASTTGFRVFTGGASNVFNEGVNKGAANLNLFFEVPSVQNADFTIVLAQHDLSGSASAFLFPLDVPGNPPYRTLGVNWGTTTTSGRLAPGIYILSASAKYDSTSVTGTAPAFEVDALFSDVTPLVATQPAPQTKNLGSTTSFSVSTNSPFETASATTASTFQWRRNLVNLVNGGRMSGVSTNTLTISNTAYADTGFYDVVVTQGTTVEASSLARLTVIPANADVDPAAAIAGVELGLPQPNPAYGRMSVRLALPSAMAAGLDVLDVSGRVVKSLVPYGRYEAGARTVEWDGSGEGSRGAAPGVYFLRLRAGSIQAVRRVVRLGAD